MNTPTRTTSANAEQTMESTRARINLTRFVHRGDRQLGLHFPYDLDLKNHLMQLDGIRWSRTHRCFYLLDTPPQLSSLISHCRGVVWLELGDLKGIEKVTTPPRSTLDREIMEKIEAYMDWMQQKRYQDTTIRTYASFVKNFFSHHPDVAWNGITQEIIIQFNHQYFIKDKRSFSAQNQWINAIKLYLKVHHLDVGDLRDIDRPRKQKYLPDVLSAEEVKKILEETSNLKHRTLLMLIYSCGLRIGETLNLRVGDVQSQEGLIYIRGGKGHKDRRVPLSPRILEQLRVYYKSYHPRAYLFEGQAGGRYSDRSAAQVLKRSVAKTGIKKRVTLHTLRHSYATHITQKGVNIQYLQEILGHNSPKTTMIYTHLSGKDIRAIRSPLDDLDI